MIFIAHVLRGGEFPVAFRLVQHRLIHVGLACRPLGAVVGVVLATEGGTVVHPDEFANDAVVKVPRRGDAHPVDQAAEGFHDEVKTVAFLGRTHFGGAPFSLVIGRGRLVDDRRVNDADARQQQALPDKVRF